MYRKLEHRKNTVRASSPEGAMDVAEARLDRLGHKVLTHEWVEEREPGKFRVETLVALNEGSR